MSTMARLRWLAILSVGAFVASNVVAERFARDEPVTVPTTSAAQPPAQSQAAAAAVATMVPRPLQGP